MIKVNTEARERRRSELKEAKLPPIKPRPEAIQPPEEERREETNGTKEEAEEEEDIKKTAEIPEETKDKDKEQNKGGKLGKFFSSFTRKQQTQVIEENGDKSESQETNSEDNGSKDPSPEKTKKKVSFFRQFSQKKDRDKEKESAADITSNDVVKTDEKILEPEVKEGPDQSTNDKDDDQDTLDDEEDSDTEESETEEDEERESQPPTLSGPALEQKTTVSNSNHSKKPPTTITTAAAQGNGGNNRIKSKSCSIL